MENQVQVKSQFTLAKMKDLAKLSVADLELKGKEVEASLFQAKLLKSTGQLSDISGPWKVRKSLARIKTLITEKSKTKKA